MSASRPRVLYLAHTLAVGGAEEMMLNLVRHLPSRFEPAVMCIDRPGPIGEEVKKTGVPFSALGLQPGLRRPIDLLRLQQAIHEKDATIVHTFLLTASLYGRFAAMLARVPIVIGTEVNIYERKQRLHRAAEGWLMRQTAAVIASAESVRDFYIDQIGADPDRGGRHLQRGRLVAALDHDEPARRGAPSSGCPPTSRRRRSSPA